MFNYGFDGILGLIFFAFPFFIYFTNILFDGIGYFRDKFHFTIRTR
jgi:hypothetical protein